MTTVKITPIEGTDLYLQYRGQHGQQPCYLSLNCQTGEFTAIVSSEIGNGVPFPVYHGHVQRWRIPCLKGHVANQLLGDLEEEAQQILDGYENYWDGHNHVARFDEDVEANIDAIQSACERFTQGDTDETIQAWEARDWFGGISLSTEIQARELGVTATTTDDELDALATKHENEAEVDMLNGTRDYLGWLRSELRKDED